MMRYRNRLLYWLSPVAFFLLVSGCSSTKAPEPTVARAPVDTSTTPGETSKPLASSPVESQSAATGSSLDALRRGESTATPASSPLKDVYFDFDAYDLRADARETLKSNAAWLKANSAAQVQIEGHCDERGTTEYNLALGSKRAQSVKDYLTALGISGDRLSTISYGEEVPVCREQDEQCWQQNRRARFVIQPAAPTT